MIVLSNEGHREWTDHYHSGGHAYHVIKSGYLIRVPSVHATFFSRLIREGRAEYVWGPHQSLQWQPDLPHDTLFHNADARFDYKLPYDLPEIDVAPTFNQADNSASLNSHHV